MSEVRSGGEVEPLVIVAAGGQPLDLVGCSVKSRTKSLEQGELWIVDRTTGRVLPWRDGVAVESFTHHERWWSATVESQQGPAAGDPPRPRADAATAPAATAPAPGEPGAGDGAEAPADRIGRVLASLSATIKRRHREMPEGSYTTHLFSKGPEKIRKKTGEEAVELILARSPEEIVAEGADLLYHLMVLLEAEGLSIAHLTAELAERHGDSE